MVDKIGQFSDRTTW